MHITLDKGSCIASGTCVLTCAAVFDQDDEGTVVLLDSSPAAAFHAQVRAAADACPTMVITVHD